MRRELRRRASEQEASGNLEEAYTTWILIAQHERAEDVSSYATDVHIAELACRLNLFAEAASLWVDIATRHQHPIYIVHACFSWLILDRPDMARRVWDEEGGSLVSEAPFRNIVMRDWFTATYVNETDCFQRHMQLFDGDTAHDALVTTYAHKLRLRAPSASTQTTPPSSPSDQVDA